VGKTCPKDVDENRLNQSLATRGLRSTRQRHHVYEALLSKRDHPTAEEIFLRAKEKMPNISFATVYNCLDTLERCDLVRQVHLDRSPTRYCPNMAEHCHFCCESCDRVLDINLPARHRMADIPMDFQVSHCEVSFRGLCPSCARRRKRSKTAQD